MKNFISLLLVFVGCFSLSAENSPKKILVTGGAGFLGSHLCERLLNEGNEVICLDNLYTGTLENIAPFLENPHFRFVEHDVTLPYDPLVELDEIYNLACPASPPFYQATPIHTLLTSVLGAYHALELSKKYEAKIFQASTSEVYGDPLEHPQKETYRGHVNPIGIRACYDEGKRAAEALFFDYHRTYGIQIKVGRIFNTYGPRMNEEDGRVVSNLILQALKEEPLTIYGSGEQTRSFCYVDDLIEGILALMNTDEKVLGPINIGNPTEYNILQLAEKIKEMTGSHSSIKFFPLPLDDPKKRRPNISLAKKTLAWEPTVPLEEGLRKTIDYFKERLKPQSECRVGS